MAKLCAWATLILLGASAQLADVDSGQRAGVSAEAGAATADASTGAKAGLRDDAPAEMKAAPMTTLERQRLLAHMEMTSTWLIDEVARLTPAQLAFRRAPEEWSIAQVVDHLLVVSPIYWSALQAAIASPMTAATKNADADLLWYGIDRTMREEAIPTEVPNGRFKALAGALAEYRTHHERLVQYLRTTGDDLRSRLVPRQGSDAYQWALLISTHEQRHVLQIREIKRDTRFPRP